MKTKGKLKPKPAEEVRRCGCKARGVPRRAKKKQAKGYEGFSNGVALGGYGLHHR